MDNKKIKKNMKNLFIILFLVTLILPYLSLGQTEVVDYKFNNNWSDASSSNNTLISHGSGTASSFQSGTMLNPIDLAVTFNSGEGLKVTNALNNSTWSGTAVSFWTKSSVSGFIYQGAYIGFGGLVDATGKLSVFFGGSSSNSLVNTSNVNLNDGNWHHIVAQNDGATTSLYIDGVLDGSKPETLLIMSGPNSSAKLYVGTAIGIGSGIPYQLNGSIDEFKLFDNILSLAQILNLYESADAHLQVSYHFDSSLVDSSIHANHLMSFGSGASTTFQTGTTFTNQDSAIKFNNGKGLVSIKTINNTYWSATAVSFWTKSCVNGFIYQGAYIGFGGLVDATGKLSVFFDGSSSNSLVNTSNVNLNDGNWHHIVAQNDGATTSLYIDGVLDGSKPETLLIMSGANSNAKLYLGIIASNTHQLNGSIDKFNLYNRILTLAQIADLANIPTGIRLNGHSTTNNIYIYPNPVNTTLNIELEKVPLDATIQIINATGQLVKVNNMSDNKKQVDVSQLTTGIYFIRITTDNKDIFVQKFIKK
jgi:hypothetical protein